MITFQQAALDEMRAAALWYEERGTGVGVRFLDAVVTATRRIVDNPRLGAPWTSPRLVNRDVRRLALKTFPYLIVYQTRKDRIVIVAIAHGRRRPGYWINRE